MSIEATREVVTAYLQNHGDPSFVAEDAVFTDTGTGQEYRGREAIAQSLEHIYHQAFEARLLSAELDEHRLAELDDDGLAGLGDDRVDETLVWMRSTLRGDSDVEGQILCESVARSGGVQLGAADAEAALDTLLQVVRADDKVHAIADAAGLPSH